VARSVASLAVVFVLLASAGAGAASGNRPPSGLTTSGNALWHFEALLRDRFGKQVACLDGKFEEDFTWNFTWKNCHYGTATYYATVFSDARTSRFHLLQEPVSETRRRINFQAAPVTLSSRAVACDPQEWTYLIRYQGTVNFAVGCLPPRR
jgi:hypothetical protein